MLAPVAHWIFLLRLFQYSATITAAATFIFGSCTKHIQRYFGVEKSMLPGWGVGPKKLKKITKILEYKRHTEAYPLANFYNIFRVCVELHAK